MHTGFFQYDRPIVDVDGKRVPAHVPIHKGGNSYLLGIEARHADGSTTKTAFCFRSPKFAEMASTAGAFATGATYGSVVSNMLMGTVKVEISEAVPSGSRPFREYSEDIFIPMSEPESMPTKTAQTAASVPVVATTALASTDEAAVPTGSVLPSLSNKQKKKVLRTAQGSFSEVTSAAKIETFKKHRTTKSWVKPTAPTKRRRYQVSDILQEVTIHYCTALGLVHANVLSKPPLWEQNRLMFGNQEGGIGPGSDAPAVRCEKIKVKVGAVFLGGTMISAAKELDFFDLTASH